VLVEEHPHAAVLELEARFAELPVGLDALPARDSSPTSAIDPAGT
jgi:hypothetical protein